MRYKARHRNVTTTSRLVSPPTIAAVTLVAGATTAAASSRGAQSAESRSQAQRVSLDARRAAVPASRAARRTPLAALPSRSVRRLLVPVTLPAGLTQPRAFDSTATLAARAQVTGRHTAFTRTRAALVAASERADAAHRAWEAARATQTQTPDLSESARTAARAARSGGLTGLAAAALQPALQAQDTTSDAYQQRLAAERALRKAADAHNASLRRLTAARDQAVRLDAADAARALAAGTATRTKDGRVVPTIKPGTPVVGNGHTVTPQVSAWIGQALDVLYSSGMPRGQRDAESLAIIIFNESGGNPAIVNTYDRNAAAGMPSFGLMQTIGPTFDAHALPTMTDKADPVAQIVAGARYAQAAYGSLDQVPGVRSLRAGGPYRPY